MPAASATAANDTIQRLQIMSPKRDRRLQSGWEGFFPYYAGFPEAFATKLLASARLRKNAVVADPWNGSGTTTFAAAQLGHSAWGFDVNPAMVVVARARLLPPSEADALRPLAATIINHVRVPRSTAPSDPLNSWFTGETSAIIRAIEEEIRRTIVGELTLGPSGVDLASMAGTAATLYVALFAASRSLAVTFRASNPTWLKKAKNEDQRVSAPRSRIIRLFTDNVRAMATSLQARRELQLISEQTDTLLQVGNTVDLKLRPRSVDCFLSSPPYCTRIDYAAATRVELAVLAGLVGDMHWQLQRAMIGSTISPKHEIEPKEAWGPTCLSFLDDVQSHKSKASSGYYLKTHLDYFDKMARSLRSIRRALRPNGVAVLVVQDSYYKDVYNDLPKIISEIAEGSGLMLAREERFTWNQSMARINPYTRTYKRTAAATESVLCFAKS